MDVDGNVDGVGGMGLGNGEWSSWANVCLGMTATKLQLSGI